MPQMHSDDGARKRHVSHGRTHAQSLFCRVLITDGAAWAQDTQLLGFVGYFSGAISEDQHFGECAYIRTVLTTDVLMADLLGWDRLLIMVPLAFQL